MSSETDREQAIRETPVGGGGSRPVGTPGRNGAEVGRRGAEQEQPAREAANPTEQLLPLIDEYRRRTPGAGDISGRFLSFLRAVPEPFSRATATGHVTGSAFITDASRTRLLLVHHAKLDKWLQPGGHCEPGETALDAALREAFEETGVRGIPLLDGAIFDLDTHRIPARDDAPEHTHWDVRFLLVAGEGGVRVSEESRAVEWTSLDEALRRNPEESMRRPVAVLRALSDAAVG